MSETAELACRVTALEKQLVEMAQELAKLRGREPEDEPVAEEPQEVAEVRLSDFVLDEGLISQAEIVNDDPTVEVVASEPPEPAAIPQLTYEPRRPARAIRDHDPFDEAMQACKTLAISAAVDQAPALPFNPRQSQREQNDLSGAARAVLY